jgi:hypothetical protein
VRPMINALKMHGLIERIPQTHHWQLSSIGLHASLFLTRLYARAIRPGKSLIDPEALQSDQALRRAFGKLATQINLLCEKEKPAAEKPDSFRGNLEA